MKTNQRGIAVLAMIIIGAIALGGYFAYDFYQNQNKNGQPEWTHPLPIREPLDNIIPEEVKIPEKPATSEENPTAKEPQKTKEESVTTEPAVSEPAQPIEFVQYPTAQDSSPIVNASNRFAFEMYDEYKNTDDNVFFSPYSITSALQMTYEGARGRTATEMQSVFHFPQDDATRIRSFAKLYEQINPQNATYQLSTANALWAQNDYPFDQNYLKTVETYYHGKATNLDFVANTEKSRKTINQWVSDKTAQKIPELFAPESLDPLTRLVLTNAVYFKSKWQNIFEKEVTQEKDFTASTGSKTKCQMMNIQNNFKYAETANYQVLELPYENNDLSMIVILPKNDLLAKVLPGNIEDNLSLEKFTEIKKLLKSELVNVSLPKFKFDTSYNMNDTLATMGMPTAFTGNADFSGMTGNRDLFIGLVVHKAYVDVYEEGTEAAAATGVAMMLSAAPTEPPQPKIFNADHPFIFAIVHNQTGTILFMGKVNDPNK